MSCARQICRALSLGICDIIRRMRKLRGSLSTIALRLPVNNLREVMMNRICLIALSVGAIFVAQGSVCVPDGLDFSAAKKELYFKLSPSDSTNHNARGLKVSGTGQDAVWAKVSKTENLERLSIEYIDPETDFVQFPVEHLSSLTNLTSLEIIGDVERPVVISSLTALASVPIEDLTLLHVVVRDAESMKTLKNLKSLKTSEPRIVRSAPTNLESLNIEGASFSCGCGLSDFTNLTNLAICGLNASYLRLGAMDRLESLCVTALCADFDEREIAACTNLTFLSVRGGSGMAPFYCLADCIKDLPLEALDVEMLPIQELRGLEKCPLKRLDICDCSWLDLSRICSMPKLERLRIIGAGISSCNRAMREELKARFPKLTYFEYDDKDFGCIDINPQTSMQ